MDQEKAKWVQVLERPKTGTILTVISGLSFFFLCMILTIVGPSGSRVVDPNHAAKNSAAFVFVLLITLMLAGTATYAKLVRRKEDNSPLPYWSIGLSVICILMFLVKMTGGFSI